MSLTTEPTASSTGTTARAAVRPHGQLRAAEQDGDQGDSPLAGGHHFVLHDGDLSHESPAPTSTRRASSLARAPSSSLFQFCPGEMSASPVTTRVFGKADASESVVAARASRPSSWQPSLRSRCWAWRVIGCRPRPCRSLTASTWRCERVGDQRSCLMTPTSCVNSSDMLPDASGSPGAIWAMSLSTSSSSRSPRACSMKPLNQLRMSV